MLQNTYLIFWGGRGEVEIIITSVMNLLENSA